MISVHDTGTAGALGELSRFRQAIATPEQFAITRMARLLHVSTSGYYKWRNAGRRRQ